MNAIILAAGIGSRMYPLSSKTPKPLLKIGNEPIIERQVRFLREADVESIYIVTGYKHNYFEYLSEKYKDLYLIQNSKYETTNNIYSLFLCKDILKNNTWIIEGDIYLTRNLFRTYSRSLYITAPKSINTYEWILKFDDTKRIDKIIVADKNLDSKYCFGQYYILSGISYWMERELKFIVHNLKHKFKNKRNYSANKLLYWDRVIFENINDIEVYVEFSNSDDWFEVDTPEEYNNLLSFVKNANI